MFIDPPFEAQDEFATLVDGLRRGYGRFAHGVFAAWYPIKQLAAVRSFLSTLASSGMRDIISVELHLRDITTAERLNGCGMVVINPPYQFAERASAVAEAVLEGLDAGEPGNGTRLVRLVDE